MAEEPDKKILYLCKTDLKNRGWTDKLIKTFLPEPDEERINPYYASADMVKLFLLEKVEAIEKSPEFIVLQDGTRKRREAAKKAAATKRDTLMKYINSLEISIPKLAEEELVQCACDHYNLLQQERNRQYISARPNSDKSFLQRIMVNYLRHEMSNYEYELERIAGKTGKMEAYDELRAKILHEIGEQYPDLFNECVDQMYPAPKF